MSKFSLMVQGTTTDAGKSVLVAGICRVLVNKGLRVAPFKPQNMALNSAVTPEGGEIGRAQAVQAEACKVAPHVNMNPVLIKPASDTGAQIIIQGKVLQDMEAANFHAYKPQALSKVMESFCNLESKYDAVIVEGAGSPAEINLREGDIANMGFAETADCPVILIADIDKGGVFAHIVGTLDLLSESERARIIGFVINKFRGDIALLESGLTWLEEKTQKPVLGVLPYIPEFYLESEDAIESSNRYKPLENAGLAEIFKVVVPVLPRISNHTDFDVLRLHPNVDLQYIPVSELPPSCDLIILPGSKNVRSDLRTLKEAGWKGALDKHLRYGGKLIGICGGYQMLGELIDDPNGIEGDPGSELGFGYIPQKIELKTTKKLEKVRGVLTLDNKTVPVSGYEIHNGISVNSQEKTNSPTLDNTDIPSSSPIKLDTDELEGYTSNDNAILGSYLHGIFDSVDACELLLSWSGLVSAAKFSITEVRERELERLADTVQKHIDIDALIENATTFISCRPQWVSIQSSSNIRAENPSSKSGDVM